jgi:hypothetical protein
MPPPGRLLRGSLGVLGGIVHGPIVRTRPAAPVIHLSVTGRSHLVTAVLAVDRHLPGT